MQVKINSANLNLKIGDITKEEVDVIVNAANSSLMGGGGVDGAIHKAGGSKILQECKQIVSQIGSLSTSKAVITTAGDMPSKYVIHTVGPIWQGGTANEESLLYNAYFNSLRLAKEKTLKTISFPSISTGAYRFPLEKASKIAIKAIKDFLLNENFLEEINLVLFNKETFLAFEKALQEQD